MPQLRFDFSASACNPGGGDHHRQIGPPFLFHASNYLENTISGKENRAHTHTNSTHLNELSKAIFNNRCVPKHKVCHSPYPVHRFGFELRKLHLMDFNDFLRVVIADCS
jgi:hypothetical protein